MWFPLTTHKPFEKYALTFFSFTAIWLACSYLLGRYKALKSQRYFNFIFKLFYTTLIVFALCWMIFVFLSDEQKLSEYVLLSVTIIAFSANYFTLFFYFAYRYATEYDLSNIPAIKRENAQQKPLPELDEEAYNRRCQMIESHSGTKTLRFLDSHSKLKSGNTYLFVFRTTEELAALPQYEYNTIIRLEKLNSSRGINKMLSIINEKLPDNGTFICCFESISTRKKLIFNRYPKGIRNIASCFDFIKHRIIPKVFITRRLYYDITGGKNRILSKTEVIGRLYCNGYEVVSDKKINNLTYITAKRVKQAEPLRTRSYGPLIRLKRFGKNKKAFTVYKFRTMYSYAEYMQAYIYQHNALQEGGKFKRDVRVTSLGKFMRKYWIDELPMIFNLIKGDMKLIGVRPLSPQYFSLYSEELQEKRVKFKPGLFPPFYADMPKNMDEIQASEMKYLEACEKNGVFLTDCRYFLKIINNILFKKARSA
jgi:lipopolysaccharide/colanic/teichoic acid biosynthesis glycosyltransferase